MLFLSLLLSILCAVASYAIGTPKGYGATLCAVAGFFGGIIAIIVILLLPDQVEEFARTTARDNARDQEIADLKKRIAELEAAQKPPHSEPSASAESVPDAASSEKIPAVFPARTNAVIACPNCNRKQMGTRSACYSCGTPFLYENE